MQSISLAAFDLEDARRAIQAVESIRIQRADRTAYAELLAHGTREEIIAFAERRDFERRPMGLASDYRRVTWEQDIWAFEGSDPRRPVIMAGSLNAMYRKWGRSPDHVSANGFATRLFFRFIRSKKWTELDAETSTRRAIKLRIAIEERHSTSYHFDQYVSSLASEGDRFIGGKLVRLTPTQLAYLGALHSIVRKTERLEDRYALVREMRLAA
jgi:hypothetical protein